MEGTPKDTTNGQATERPLELEVEVELKPGEVEELAHDLEAIEAWCTKNRVAGSALGRQVLQDQAAITRWRTTGARGCSFAKRRLLAEYVLLHPEGIPGYTRSYTGRKKGRHNPGARFTPNKSITGSRAGQLTNPQELHHQYPTPALEQLDQADDMRWVKQKAMHRGCTIVQVLAEMVGLGIRVARETEYEEAEAELLEQEKNNANS